VSSVLVLVEHRQGAIRDVTFEMLTAARKLAAPADGKVEAVLFGDGCDAMLPGLQSQADRVVYAAGPAFKDFNYEPYQKALVKLVAERKPSAVLIANSAFGTDLGPSLAVALNAGLVSDAVAFAKADSGFAVSRGRALGRGRRRIGRQDEVPEP
jgi:electron transfer flavoprotein alpha subunit